MGEYWGWNEETPNRHPNLDGRLVFDGAIPAIVTEEEWTIVQRMRETKKQPVRITGEQNSLDAEIEKLQVDIHLNFIGNFELPLLEMPQEEPQKLQAQEVASYNVI